MKLNEKFKEKKLVYSLVSTVVIVIILVTSFIGWNILNSDDELKVIIINTYNDESWVEFTILEENLDNINEFGPLYGDNTNLSFSESYTYHVKFDKSHKILGVRIRIPNYADYVYWFPENSYYNLIAVIAPPRNATFNYSEDTSYVIEEVSPSIADIVFTKLKEPLYVARAPI